ncbi:hypothetical protein G7Y89_g9151 [Cudoniella acicularis]|uniref:Uncharacterized protein n=1 Tax=Cudoniella acicularis TaxID=354080 RepID=A0A8H4RI08_9HELO|nr:hypothetical protein G7Y89_g9151 [Cudoniella acicularis]
MEFQKGQPQSLPHHHKVHCLDKLVFDVKCNADDTLRLLSWDALQKWTLENAGCYRYGDPNIEDHAKSQIPRYRFCPENSEDLEYVREYFGKGKDWKPYEEKAWSWDEGWVPSETGLED